jgi:hypothetical protein
MVEYKDSDIYMDVIYMSLSFIRVFYAFYVFWSDQIWFQIQIIKQK